MTRFKTKEEFDSFCDKSMVCVCGRLMTGLHMRGCRKLIKMGMRFDKEISA